MFEVTGSDIAALTDVDLRTLVARLALAELRKAGLPRSSVTAGGNQTAPDGGLDVRVSVPCAMTSPDFVPRSETGFQVKKPDMSPSAITEEMKPKGELRTVFSELAGKDGAYIIVSAQGSVADKPLRDRRKAMRDALSGMQDAGRLYVDFYDRDRLANWVNCFQGVAAWVMAGAGRRLCGWSAIGEWAGMRAGETDHYLTDGEICVVDETTAGRGALSLLDAVSRMRHSLSKPAACVRLIGLSGVGKTRLVHALFEDGVGTDPLDPGIAIYTDYSDNIDPTARDMARQLIATGDRAILIVDNCNPATHSELSKICGASGSRVSLLTVEYDVRDDEPEHTEVFRLQPVSPDLIGNWIEKTFPSISQVDRDRIANFSGGNFRVASALSNTVRKGETLAQLKSRDLFARIFEQRTGPDINLLQASEDLSLLYSYDGEDTSDTSELTKIASIRGITAQHLFLATAELKRREIVQVRGRWRALLPHAISNGLAALALERISPSDFDSFCQNLSPRMLRSLSRRLGYLHNSRDARATVGRWLDVGGPLADLTALDEEGIAILRNLAPVAPEAVLEKIRLATLGSNADALISATARSRGSLIGLVKALAFEPEMFETAALTLVRFASVEPAESNNHPACDSFTELFHLYLSGTKAPIEQRITLARRLAKSSDDGDRRCGMMALEGLLKAGHFMSSHSFDFGARPRDYGWQPETQEDIQNWFSKAIRLAIELRNFRGVGETFARCIRSLWSSTSCQEDLDEAATAFSDGGVWIDGWLNFLAALRYEGRGMPGDIRRQLEQIIDRLKPVELLDRARALIFDWSNSAFDLADVEQEQGEPFDFHVAYRLASDRTVEIGKAVALSQSNLDTFLREIFAAQQTPRAREFGRGLAQGTLNLGEMWSALTTAYAATATDLRNPTMIGGFLAEAHAQDPKFAATALDAAIDEPSLTSTLVFLQACVAVDADGIARLRRAIGKGILSRKDFLHIANGSIQNAPPSDFIDLLSDVSSLPGGIVFAVRLLDIYFFCHKEHQSQITPQLIDAGRNLLLRLDFNRNAPWRDADLQSIVRQCLAGVGAELTTSLICHNVRSNLAAWNVSNHDIAYLLESLFEVQPIAVLNEFLLRGGPDSNVLPIPLYYAKRMPIESIAPDVLTAWADQDPGIRYNLLGQIIGIFPKEDAENQLQLSPSFFALLDAAPDKLTFLGDYYHHLQPEVWGGSLADVLVKRRDAIRRLGDHRDGFVRQWVVDMEDYVANWIETERQRDRRQEESFE